MSNRIDDQFAKHQLPKVEPQSSSFMRFDASATTTTETSRTVAELVISRRVQFKAAMAFACGGRL
jgi:hypothetical protein